MTSRLVSNDDSSTRYQRTIWVQVLSKEKLVLIERIMFVQRHVGNSFQVMRMLAVAHHVHVHARGQVAKDHVNYRT